MGPGPVLTVSAACISPGRWESTGSASAYGEFSSLDGWGRRFSALDVELLWHRDCARAHGVASPRRLPLRRSRRAGPHCRSPVSQLIFCALAHPRGRRRLGGDMQRNGWEFYPGGSTPEWLAVVIAVASIDSRALPSPLTPSSYAWLWRVHGPTIQIWIRFHDRPQISPDDAILSTVVASWNSHARRGAPACSTPRRIARESKRARQHANVRVRPRIDRLLRPCVVTPDMHRIHHSRALGDRKQLATTFSCWDRGVWNVPRHFVVRCDGPRIGLAEFDDPSISGSLMLAQPFITEDRPDRGPAGSFFVPSSRNSPVPLTTDVAAIWTFSGEDELSTSCHRRGVRQDIREPHRAQRIPLTTLVRRDSDSLFAQISSVHMRRKTYAAVVESPAWRPLDGVGATLKTRRPDTVVVHVRVDRLTRTKSQPSAEFPH